MKHAAEIKAALAAATDPSRLILDDTSASPDRLRYAVLLNQQAVQEFIQPFRRQEARIRQIQADLWRHAFDCIGKFNRRVTFALDTYFTEKAGLMAETSKRKAVGTRPSPTWRNKPGVW